MPPEILQAIGTREAKIAAARRVKEAFERDTPDMAALRQGLIAAGMCADNFSSILGFRNADIDYRKTRDDPDHFARQHAKPPLTTPEITHAVQARKDRLARAADTPFDFRGGRGRGKKPVAR